jgi:hypothetical protein
MMPPERKMVEESSAAFPALLRLTSFSRAKRKAITTVAKTSKKPSTHRWTTHQRQYSATARLVCRPAPSAAP